MFISVISYRFRFNGQRGVRQDIVNPVRAKISLFSATDPTTRLGASHRIRETTAIVAATKPATTIGVGIAAPSGAGPTSIVAAEEARTTVGTAAAGGGINAGGRAWLITGLYAIYGPCKANTSTYCGKRS